MCQALQAPGCNGCAHTAHLCRLGIITEEVSGSHCRHTVQGAAIWLFILSRPFAWAPYFTMTLVPRLRLLATVLPCCVCWRWRWRRKTGDKTADARARHNHQNANSTAAPCVR